MDSGVWQSTVHVGCQELDITEQLTVSLFHIYIYASPALAGRFFITEPPGKHIYIYKYIICTEREYYSTMEKNEIMPFCSNMDEPRDCHTNCSKSERERQIPYGITYMWNPKYDTNETEAELGAQR